MRPLPRILAVADNATCDLPDFAIKAAAMLSIGPSVGVVITSSGERVRHDASRVRRLARPTEAATFVRGAPSLAQELEAQGVVLPAGVGYAAREQFAGAVGVELGWSGPSHDVDFVVAGGLAADAITGPVGEARQLSKPVYAVDWPAMLRRDSGSVGQAQLSRLKAARAYGVIVGPGWWEGRDLAADTIRLLEAWAG